MEEKEYNYIRINLVTILLIVLLVISIIVGIIVFILSRNNQTTGTVANTSTNTNTNINTNTNTNTLHSSSNTIDNTISAPSYAPSTTTESDHTQENNNYVFNLDSNNKYIVHTDSRWLTMMNDGGSNIDIYYQIDLDNNIVQKINENFHANLAGTTTTDITTVFTKKIDDNLKQKINSVLNDAITKADLFKSTNYNFFTISSLNLDKNIYLKESIDEINTILEQIDNL